MHIINENSINMRRVIVLCCILFSSCSDDPALIYVDLQKQAIVSCSNNFHSHLEINGGDENITLQGAWPTVYFNQPVKAMTILVNGEKTDSLFLQLKPSSAYEIWKENAADRGPLRITMETDSTGRVVAASVTDCK